jgi:hypothetical protein
MAKRKVTREAQAPSEDVTDKDPLEAIDTSQGNDRRPYDPNQIRTKKIDPTVSLLMGKLEAEELDLALDFQRNVGLWDNGKRSRLIESVLMRIPLPDMYFDELPAKEGMDTRYGVIDGIQRLTALSQFINEKKDDKRLKLSGLEVLTHLEGKTFDGENGLDSALQRRILNTQFVAYVFELGTPSAIKLNIFKRLNTGGVSLTPQEIRHAMNPGPVRNLLAEMAKLPAFAEAVGEKAAERMNLRMEDREWACRFLAFVDGGQQRYENSKTDFDGFLENTMQNANKMSPASLKKLKERYERALQTAHACFGDVVFRKPGARSGQLNKALFEATVVALDERTDAEHATLKKHRDKLQEVYRIKFENKENLAAVSLATSDVTRVKRRFDALRNVVVEALA